LFNIEILAQFILQTNEQANTRNKVCFAGTEWLANH